MGKKPETVAAIRRDGTPMSGEERKYKEAVFARIQQDLWEGVKPKAEIVEFPPNTRTAPEAAGH